MSAGKARLTAAAMVFVGWLLFLIWLASTAGKPVVVSRPQFLVANLYVVAELQDGGVLPAPLTVPLPSVVALPQAGWPTSIPWAELGQFTCDDPKALPPAVGVPAHVVGDGPSEQIKVKETLWPYAKQFPKGPVWFVRNLRLCDQKYGWRGPGLYVLPLTSSVGKKGIEYRVTAMPRSPGYDPPAVNAEVHMAPALIYRDTPLVRSQVEQIIRDYHGN